MSRMRWITLGVLAAATGCHPSPPPPRHAPPSHASPGDPSPSAGSAGAVAVTPTPPMAAPEAVEPGVVGAPAVVVDQLRLLPGKAGDALQLRAYHPAGADEREHGMLQIDGVRTQAKWPDRHNRLTQFRIDQHRHLIFDSYHGGLLYLWDTRDKTLTGFGRKRLRSIGGQSMLFSWEFQPLQLHPDKPELVPLYQPPKKHRLSEAGIHRGQVLLVYSPPMAATGIGIDFTPPARLVWLRAGAPPREVSVDLNGLSVASSDGVRGDRLLLIGARPKLGVANGPLNGFPSGFAWDSPFDTGIAVLDLNTLKVRKLGIAKGGWTQFTAMPHPYVRAGWGMAKAPPPGPPGLIGECFNLVHPQTEVITHVDCDPNSSP